MITEEEEWQRNLIKEGQPREGEKSALKRVTGGENACPSHTRERRAEKDQLIRGEASWGKKVKLEGRVEKGG